MALPTDGLLFCVPLGCNQGSSTGAFGKKKIFAKLEYHIDKLLWVWYYYFTEKHRIFCANMGLSFIFLNFL